MSNFTPLSKTPFSKTGKQMSIADLYPDLTSDQQKEAEFHLTRYLEVVRRIFERTKNLTDSGDSDRV